MHQRCISLDDYAIIFPALEVLGRVDTGPVLVVSGQHPDLGAVTVWQDMSPDLMLISERSADRALAVTQGKPLSGLQR